MNGCWAALLVVDRSLGLPFDGAFVHESALSWIARNNSKPQRGSQESWVLHASPEWTSTYLEDEPGETLPKMLDAFWHATAVTPRAPIYAACHRWRWALPPEPLPPKPVSEVLHRRAMQDELLAMKPILRQQQRFLDQDADVGVTQRGVVGKQLVRVNQRSKHDGSGRSMGRSHN